MDVMKKYEAQREAMKAQELVMDAERTMVLYYDNHRDESRVYKVIPHNMWFGRTDFYPGDEQWFIRATDVDRGVVRDFAMARITSWETP